MMNENDLTQIKAIVLAEIDKLEQDIRYLEEAVKPVAPDNAYGCISRMDAINNRAVAEATFINKKATLQNYRNVLDKIDSGQYGKCTRCGEGINMERLKVIPYTECCMACAR